MGLLDREQDLMIVHGAMTRDLEAAEAEAAKWHEMHDDRDHDLKHEYARATAADAECERLRAQVAALLPANAMMAADLGASEREAERLRAAYNVSQDESYRLANNVEAAEAEVVRLRTALRDLDAMRRNFNAGWERVTANSDQDAR